LFNDLRYNCPVHSSGFRTVFSKKRGLRAFKYNKGERSVKFVIFTEVDEDEKRLFMQNYLPKIQDDNSLLHYLPVVFNSTGLTLEDIFRKESIHFHKVYNKRLVAARDEQGQFVLDEQGEPVMNLVLETIPFDETNEWKMFIKVGRDHECEILDKTYKFTRRVDTQAYILSIETLDELKAVVTQYEMNTDFEETGYMCNCGVTNDEPLYALCVPDYVENRICRELNILARAKPDQV